MDSKDVAKIFTGLTNKFGSIKIIHELCKTLNNYKNYNYGKHTFGND